MPAPAFPVVRPTTEPAPAPTKPPKKVPPGRDKKR